MILDSLRGELGPDEAAAFARRLATDPALSAERDRVRSLLVREQAAQASALEATLDAKAADRMSARILDRVRREEDRPVVVPGRRRLWVRLLAASVAVHVLALGVLSWRHLDTTAREREVPRDPSVVLLPQGDAEPGDGMFDGTSEPGSEPGIESTVPGRYVVENDRLPVEDLLPDALPAPVSASDRPFAMLPRGAGKAMWVRSNDTAKRLIESRTGAPGNLERIKAGLAALARVQAEDGSFADGEGAPSVRASATVLLAFLSDGHSSRGGEHRAVVERGIGWLSDRVSDARAPLSDRALALFALSEDLILSGGSMTPGEARLRRMSALALATSVRDDAQAARGSSAAGSKRAAMPEPAVIDARWSELALLAAARAGIVASTTTLTASVALIDVGAIRAGDDARTAMLDGTALLKDRRGMAFGSWNAATARTLSSRLGSDGLVGGAGSGATRAEQTALVLLALEVAYRTY